MPAGSRLRLIMTRWRSVMGPPSRHRWSESTTARRPLTSSSALAITCTSSSPPTTAAPVRASKSAMRVSQPSLASWLNPKWIPNWHVVHYMVRESRWLMPYASALSQRVGSPFGSSRYFMLGNRSAILARLIGDWLEPVLFSLTEFQGAFQMSAGPPKTSE